MSLFSLVLVLVVVGFFLWLISLIPQIDATFKKIIYGVVIFFTVLWILQQFGLISGLNLRLK